MIWLHSGHLPTNNPCAQCGKLIRAPSWSESDRDKIHFIWRCEACNYEFQTIAMYAQRVGQKAA